MVLRKPSLAVWIVGSLSIMAGVLGFVHHFPHAVAVQSETVWAERTERLAIVAGIFLLTG